MIVPGGGFPGHAAPAARPRRSSLRSFCVNLLQWVCTLDLSNGWHNVGRRDSTRAILEVHFFLRLHDHEALALKNHLDRFAAAPS